MMTMNRLPFRRVVAFCIAVYLLAGCVLQPANLPPVTPTSVRVITDTPVPTPFVMPTPPPSPTASCAGAPRERLIIGERGRVLEDDPRNVNVRSKPGVDNILMTVIPINGLFLVLDGPVCLGGYQWYKVRYREVTGWIAEGDLTSYYVEPYGTG